MRKRKIKLFVICFIAVVLLSVGVFMQSLNESVYNQKPPVLELASDYTGSTTVGSSAAYVYDSNSPRFIGNDSNSLSFDSQSVNFLYSSNDSSFGSFLSRIDGINSGKFRFLTFGRFGVASSYYANPAEYYLSNFGPSEFCCQDLTTSTNISKNRVLMVYNSFPYDYLPNPTDDVMNSGSINLNYDGWHLLWLGDNLNLNIKDGSKVLTAFLMSSDSLSSTQVFSAEEGSDFDLSNLESGIYWVNVGLINPDILGVSPDDPLYESLKEVMDLLKLAQQQAGPGNDIEINITNVSVGSINANCFNSLLGDNNQSGDLTDSCNSSDLNAIKSAVQEVVDLN